MWKLVIEDDEGKRTVVPLTRDDYTIGRQEGNTIRLTERNVSRTHTRVRRNRGVNGASDVFVLEDLRSYNGVFVNGLRVAHHQDLQHGDLIQVGDYRLVLQDDTAADAAAIPVTTDVDPKSTAQMPPPFRGQHLADRPNRLVMLVGPTPGLEYPLDQERMTLGRAEDASISVNHNSVSRFHCEVHALGDGRFEIVDKGSSNGVRVNAADLRRSIIEAGDVIELGDVRFKFVGAGQVFVAGPNESQQLTAISDREAELVDNSRRGGYVLPIVGAGIVGAALILVFVYVLRMRAVDHAVPQGPAAPTEAEIALVADAKRSCTVEDCRDAHQRINTLPESSPLRESDDFMQIEATWADSVLQKARAEQAVATRRSMLQAILDAPQVNAQKKKEAADLLNGSIDGPSLAPTDLPTVAREGGGAPIAPIVIAPPPSTKPVPTSHATVTNATTTTTTTVGPSSAPPSTATPSPTSQRAQDAEKAREALKNGQPAVARTLLEKRVRAGNANIDEARMLRAACKAMHDKDCSDEVATKYPALLNNN